MGTTLPSREILFFLLALSLSIFSGCEAFDRFFRGELYSVSVSVAEGSGGTYHISADGPNEGGGGYKYREGTRVNISAEPAADSAFASWQGSYSAYQETLSFSINRDVNLTLNFSSLENSWLILIYMAAANSLESEGLRDLNSMELGLSRIDRTALGSVKVLALFDRISADDMNKHGLGYFDTIKDGDWSGTRLYELLPDRNAEKINSRLIEQAGPWRLGPDQEESMGNKETLASFIAWARETYPGYARHALILWNHGGGVSIARSAAGDPRESVCLDDEDRDAGGAYGLNGQLFMEEIREVLSRFYGPSRRLDFIGFDNCYGGMYEIAYQFRNVADYFAASPGLEYTGWNYAHLLAAAPGITDAREFARQAVLGFKDASGRYNHTLTGWELSKTPALKTAVDKLAGTIWQEIESGSFTREQLETLRESRETIFFYTGSPTVDDSHQYPFYELGTLCESLKTGGNAAIAAEAENVREALKQGTVYAWKSSAYTGPAYNGAGIPYGLSIFFSRGNKKLGNGLSHYANHWYYTALDTNTEYAPGFYYGRLDAADSNSNGRVETWRELLEYLYDPGNVYTPGSY